MSIKLFFQVDQAAFEDEKFFGRSFNGVHNQIVTALSAHLLLMLYSQTHGLHNTLWEDLGLISANLFNRSVSAE